MTARPVRKRLRLKGYDYSSGGAYFVTIVAIGRRMLIDDEAVASAVTEAWLWLASQYSYVDLDQFVIMPNHLHAIVFLSDVDRGERKTLSSLIGAFKTVSTKKVNLLKGRPGQVIWQRSFYERVIRNDDELNRIRQYVINSPARWEEDPENPARH